MRPGSIVTSVGLIVIPDPADGFVPPSHIDRGSLDALPPSPGVYLFRDAAGTPIYIGKSINIRHRVFSHLRTPAEAAMLQDTARVDCIPTAGDIGALLLEAQLIRAWQPAWNAQLVHESAAFAIGMDAATGFACVVGEWDAHWPDDAPRYGLFPSKRSAQEGLRQLVRAHGLCDALTGLENVRRGRACFAHQLGQCRGACAGRESAHAHAARLHIALEALAQSVWPYPGPIGIVEEGAGGRQTHVIEHWNYLGSLQGRRRVLPRPRHLKADVAVYRIVHRAVRESSVRLVDCEVRARSVVLPADAAQAKTAKTATSTTSRPPHKN